MYRSWEVFRCAVGSLSSAVACDPDKPPPISDLGILFCGLSWLPFIPIPIDDGPDSTSSVRVLFFGRDSLSGPEVPLVGVPLRLGLLKSLASSASISARLRLSRRRIPNFLRVVLCLVLYEFFRLARRFVLSGSGRLLASLMRAPYFSSAFFMIWWNSASFSRVKCEYRLSPGVPVD